MDLLEKYSQQIAEELKIDDFTVNDVQLRAPARKHYWVARLINHKIEVDKLKKKKAHIKKEIIEKLIENAPIKMTTASAERSIENTPDIAAINEQIKDLEYIVEYLEKVEKIYSSLTYDLKNICALRQMETM